MILVIHGLRRSEVMAIEVDSGMDLAVRGRAQAGVTVYHYWIRQTTLTVLHPGGRKGLDCTHPEKGRNNYEG